jgi:PilZ domain
VANTGYSGIEKRKHHRTIYPPARRPVFQTGGQSFAVKDLSRGGLKFRRQENIKLKGWVKGTVGLADGRCIEVEGIVVRVEDRDMGLSFIGELEEHAYRQITAGSANGD